VNTVEEHMKKIVSTHQREWNERLPVFLLACRTSTHETKGKTPRMVFESEQPKGRHIVTFAAVSSAKARGVSTGRCTQARIIPLPSAVSHDVKHLMHTEYSGSFWMVVKEQAAPRRFPGL
jgi:hypothetical protein